jgi:hypothetical protein
MKAYCFNRQDFEADERQIPDKRRSLRESRGSGGSRLIRARPPN